MTILSRSVAVAVAVAACGSAESTHRIRLEHVATLGSTEGPGAMPSVAGGIARGGEGRFYVTTPERGPELPFVYGHDGAFLRRLGRAGRGPGEFRRPNALIADGDTLHVFDMGTGRITVLGPTLETVRVVDGIPSATHVARLSDGSYVVNNAGRGWPLRRFDPAGTPVGEFGGAPQERIVDAWWRNTRVLAPSRHGGLWSVSGFYEYKVERWDRGGTRELELVPASDWFVPYDSLRDPTPTIPPAAKITGVWEDEDGRVWILGMASDPEWGEALSEPRWLEGRFVYAVEDPARAYDGVIDVLDPATGVVIASRRIDDVGVLLTVVGPSLIAARREGEGGSWFVEVWRLSLAE